MPRVLRRAPWRLAVCRDEGLRAPEARLAKLAHAKRRTSLDEHVVWAARTRLVEVLRRATGSATV